MCTSNMLTLFDWNLKGQRGSSKTLWNKITKLGNLCFQAFGVSKKFLCLNVSKCDGRVPHFVYAYFEPISISNMLMKFNLNWKRLRGSYKMLYDIKCIPLALRLYRWYIRGWGISNKVVCLIPSMFLLNLYLKEISLWSLIEIERGWGGRIRSYKT